MVMVVLLHAGDVNGLRAENMRTLNAAEV